MIRGRLCTLCRSVLMLPESAVRFPVQMPRLASVTKVQGRYMGSANDGFDKQGSYEGPGKTTVTILNQEMQGINLIDSYSSSGFRLNDNSFLIGPSIIFPTAVFSWNIRSATDITEESLAIFTMLDPRLDLLVIGHGQESTVRNAVDIKSILGVKQKGLNLEILATDKAISTYNYLIEEGRVVAAALIPPLYVKDLDDDSVVENAHRKEGVGVTNVSMFGMSRVERRNFLERELREKKLLDDAIADNMREK